MKRTILIAMFAIALSAAAPASGQLIFKKAAKINPTQRVPELILIVKSDSDDRKRAHAAEELREYDTTRFSEIVPVLADVLLHDKKQSVRMEALASLSKIRPVSATAGQAIEKAAANDEALRVRLQAKAALTKYHLAGYSPKKTETSSVSSKKTVEEPPLIIQPPVPPVIVPPIVPPPAAQPPLPPPRVDDPRIPRPLPPGMAPTPPAKAPSAKAPSEGPSLFPEK